MKNRIFIFISLFTLLLTSCIIIVGTITSGIEKYTISFDSDGGSIVKEQIVEEGQFIIEPKDPIKENFKFICWEYNNVRYDFNTPVKSNITLVAKWEEVNIDIHEHNYKKEVFNSTCTEYGYTLYTCECGDTYKDNFLPTLEHSFIYHEKVEPTCTEIGCEAYIECSKCTYSTYKELPALDHDLTTHEAKEPTDIEIGWKEYVTCSRCEYNTYEELPIIQIVHDDLEVYEENGYKYFNYGSYPQTHVNDEELLKELNNLKETNERGYYEFKGKEYAKVETKHFYFGGLNETDIYGNVLSISYPYKYSTGKIIMNYKSIEWFIVEPIKWRILSIENNKYQVLSEYILTAHKYYKYIFYRQIDGVDIAPNNYKYSDIRSFLNKEFINSAFTIEQQNTLITTEVDNSASTTTSSANKFVCENTFDKIYLLSYKDLRNSDFGFIEYEFKQKQAKVTDYAKATGAYWSTDEEHLDCGHWWLRSPYFSDYYYAHCVGDYGYEYIVSYVDHYYLGVRPATAIAVN